MALEDLTGASKFIGNLVTTNPLAADDRREGDDHMRGIKNVLRNSFPNITGAVTATQGALNTAAASDPATKVNKAGDTMSGALVVNAVASVDNRVHVRGIGGGETAFDGAGPGLWLTAGSLSTAAKITPAVRFGTTDADVVGENPKTTAAIWGEAGQTFTGDTASAMDLVFGTSPSGGGVADTVLERMRVTASGKLLVGVAPATQNVEVEVAGRIGSTNLNGFLGILGNIVNVTFGFLTSLNTGMYAPAVGQLGLVAAGVRRWWVNGDGDALTLARSTAPTVANMANGEVCYSRVSDTSLRIYMRGNDGVLRSVALTLA